MRQNCSAVTPTIAGTRDPNHDHAGIVSSVSQTSVSRNLASLIVDSIHVFPPIAAKSRVMGDAQTMQTANWLKRIILDVSCTDEIASVCSLVHLPCTARYGYEENHSLLQVIWRSRSHTDIRGRASIPEFPYITLIEANDTSAF